MKDDVGICGRAKEIKELHNFITSRVDKKTSGILYLTGPPGTGKSMSVQYVLDNISSVSKLNINCLKAPSSKVILKAICNSVNLDKFTSLSEHEMIDRLTKKFSDRTSKPHLIVLDEMDQLPKSKCDNLFKKIFSWPDEPNSKLILIGIANTYNLTSRQQSIHLILGKQYDKINKLTFRPYTISEIKDILQWYLDNDENYEDASIDPKVIQMIATKSARADGDIRGALNAMKSAILDNVSAHKRRTRQIQAHNEPYLTPPSSPPMTPRKELLKPANLASFANSEKKRQKSTNYEDDKFPFQHQVVFATVFVLCSKTKDSSARTQVCISTVEYALKKLNILTTKVEILAMLDNLETMGLIGVKKARNLEKVIMKASESELESRILNKDMIMDLIKTIV